MNTFIVIGFIGGLAIGTYGLLWKACLAETQRKDLEPNFEYSLAKFGLDKKRANHLIICGALIILVMIMVHFA